MAVAVHWVFLQRATLMWAGIELGTWARSRAYRRRRRRLVAPLALMKVVHEVGGCYRQGWS